STPSRASTTVKPSRSSVARISERTTGSSSTTRIDALGVSFVSCISSSKDLACADRTVLVSMAGKARARSLKRVDEFSAKRRCHGQLGGPFFGFQQRIQLTGRGRHFRLK